MVVGMKMMNLNIIMLMLIWMALRLSNLLIQEEQVDLDVRLQILILEGGLRMIQIMNQRLLVILKYL